MTPVTRPRSRTSTVTPGRCAFVVASRREPRLAHGLLGGGLGQQSNHTHQPQRSSFLSIQEVGFLGLCTVHPHEPYCSGASVICPYMGSLSGSLNHLRSWERRLPLALCPIWQQQVLTSFRTKRAATPIALTPHQELRPFGARAALSASKMEQVEVLDPVQQRLMFEDECILVDENDNVVGHDSKYNCHLMAKIEAENLLHRAFSVFLFNAKNELLLQKRSATKVTFPLVWTNTCCSHPLYRDSELIAEDNLGVRNAAQRKLFDELGIVAKDAPVEDFTVLGRILYKAPSDGKWGEHELDYLLITKRDVEVKPNPEEVSDVQFVNKEQLLELVRKADAGEEGVKLSPWFRLVVDNFLFNWWKKLENGTLGEAIDPKIHKLT